MDILAYTYDSGNKLLRVTDTGNTTFGFKDGSNTGNDYAYDANGNMTVDNNKNISGIVYNHLNLPTRINVNGGTEYINYIYDAAGTKLKKIATTTNGKIFTEYAGNYIYKNSNLEFFSHSEGIVEHEADGYKYVYQFKDHLDNIRLSYKDANKDGIVTKDEVIQEKNYYPFGLQHEGYNSILRGRNHNYGFGNKEEQNELNLNWIDITARNYDAALGRWMNIDPLADHPKQFNMSPYSAMWNNPIKYNDPDGKCPQCATGAIVGVLTEFVAQVGSNMLDGMSFSDAMKFKNLDGTDILAAGGIGFLEGAISGGMTKAARFFAKSRNRKIIGMLFDKGIDVVLEFTENVMKNVMNNEDFSAKKMKSSLVGALAEVGLGDLLPSIKTLNRYSKNQEGILKRMEKRISKAEKKGKKAKSKYIKRAKQAQKNINQTNTLRGVLNSPKGAVGEIGGNKVSDQYENQ